MLLFFVATVTFLHSMSFAIVLKVLMLNLAWKLKAEQMGFFTLDEWVHGMTELQYKFSSFTF